MKTITITEKDLQKRIPIVEDKKYRHSFSPSGMLIDELAYCAGQWTSEDLYENNFEYEPSVPYKYNYEKDLFEHTKTLAQLQGIANSLDISINETLFTKMNLQAGAYCALHMPEHWKTILEAYTDKLHEDGTDGTSEDYNKELQDEKDSYNEDQYREWLNGDHRDYAGVVHEIAKYFTEERDGSYSPYNDKTKKEASYTFTLNEDDIEKYKESGYRSNQIKGALIDEIVSSGNAREYKDKQEREKRRAECDRLAIYKKEQAEKEEAERKAKLLSMTIK